jgi:hypothetical protein
MFRKDTAGYSGVVHESPSILGEIVDVPRDFSITHNWAPNRAHVLEKHRRYVALERTARWQSGRNVPLSKCLMLAAGAFATSFFTCRGYLDRWRGFALSVFYGHYVFRSNHVTERSQR